MIKALRDRLSGLVFLILSCWVMIESVRLRLGTVHNPGPGFMPFFIGLFLGLLSILSFFSLGPRLKNEDFWRAWKRSQGTIQIFAGLIIYLLLLKVLGFYIDTFLLLFFLFRFSGEKGIKRPFLVSLATMGVTYLLFYKLLFIPFPKGFLGV